MQTITVNIEDSFMQDFLAIVKHHKGKIEILEEENLTYDPYYHERKKQLQQDIEDIDSGRVEMLSQEEYEREMTLFFTKLKSKYGN